MIRSRRALVISIALIAALGASCSNSRRANRAPTTTTSTGSATAGGISEQQAIDIAKQEWARQEPKFDFAATRPEADPIAGTYDVAFVPTDITGPGGEPHVVVDRTTGKVVRTYRTK